MVTPRRVPLQSPIKQLRVEYGYADGHIWRIWLTANGDFTLGTFIELGYGGSIKRITWHPDGTESVFEVTDDKD